MEFIDLQTDWAFKKVFGSEESKDILIHFLNGLLKPKIKIASVTLENPYNVKELAIEKDSYVDIKAKLEDGSKVIIEMQVLHHKSFFERLMFYAAKSYSSQLFKKEEYTKLTPVTTIAIIAFDDYPEITNYHHHYVMQDTVTHTKYPETMDVHIISLNNFKKEEKSCSNIEDMFLYCIKMAFTFKEMPSFSDNLIKRALEMANKATLTKKELDLIERRADFVRINKEALEWATEKGLAQGVAKGLAQGEAKEKIATIQEMLKNDFSWDVITKITKVSEEEYAKLMADR